MYIYIRDIIQHFSIFNSGTRPERLRVACSRTTNSDSEAGTIPDTKSSASKEQMRLIRMLKKRLTADGGSFVAISRKFRAMDLDKNGVIDIDGSHNCKLCST